jgi:hypothetical protein
LNENVRSPVLIDMLCVHVGQCGNQVGQEFWELATASTPVSSCSPLYNQPDGMARCVMVDSEPKVISNVMAQGRIPIDHRAVVWDQNGRGNNWAMGFYGSRGCTLVDRAMEAIRRQVEKMDSFGGTVLMHSLSGGTGAGLGSRLVQELRCQYPSPYIATVSVGAFECGDTPLQNYNSILSLQTLNEFADAIIYKGNDALLQSLLQVT